MEVNKKILYKKIFTLKKILYKKMFALKIFCIGVDTIRVGFNITGRAQNFGTMMADRKLL